MPRYLLYVLKKVSPMRAFRRVICSVSSKVRSGPKQATCLGADALAADATGDPSRVEADMTRDLGERWGRPLV